MANFISLLFYLAYKAGILYSSYYILSFFKLRYDETVLYFYAFLSFFQFLFIFFQTISRNRKEEGFPTARNTAIFQYTTIITILMEEIIIGLIGYYLYQLENDLLSIGFLISSITIFHAVFYYMHSRIFNFVIKKRNIIIKRASVLPVFIFILVCFAIPIGYITLKYFIKKEFSLYDTLVFSSIMAVNMIVIFFMFAAKAIKAKRIASFINNISLVSPVKEMRVDDPYEFGAIESAIKVFLEKLKKETSYVTLFSDYLSQKIKKEISQYGVKYQGEQKIASVSTIKIKILTEDISPESYLSFINRCLSIIGEHSYEYEAYPYFHSNKVNLAFGIPYHYEHQKYNSIEATQKIITDIEKSIEKEDIEVRIYAGIYSGSVIAGAVNTKGKDIKEYIISGDAVELSERIVTAAESLNVRILVAENVLEGLSSRFSSERSFKLKLKDGEELLLKELKS